jgi:hypothetical protein
VDRAFTACASTYQVFATGQNAAQNPSKSPSYATMLDMRRYAGGEVFNVGSVAFGQSLMSDSLKASASQQLTPVIKNAIARLSTLHPPQTAPPSDFNGDGAPDILARKPDGTLWFYPGNGSGALLSGTQVGSSWNIFNAIVPIKDFDGDGCSDIITRNTGALSEWANGTLSLYLTDARGATTDGSLIDGANGWQGVSLIVAPGDWNGDAKPDLIARNSTGNLVLYTGNGSGGFISGAVIPGTNGWGGINMLVAPGDWNGDGKPDLIGRVAATGDLWMYTGNGVGGISGQQLIGTSWQNFDAILGMGDFSGDGKPDLIARGVYGSDAGKLLLFTGSGNSSGAFLGGPFTVGTSFQVFDSVYAVR